MVAVPRCKLGDTYRLGGAVDERKLAQDLTAQNNIVCW